MAAGRRRGDGGLDDTRPGTCSAASACAGGAGAAAGRAPARGRPEPGRPVPRPLPPRRGRSTACCEPADGDCTANATTASTSRQRRRWSSVHDADHGGDGRSRLRSGWLGRGCGLDARSTSTCSSSRSRPTSTRGSSGSTATSTTTSPGAGPASGWRSSWPASRRRDAAARARLAAGAPLVDRRLVVVEDADRPFLTRALRVPDRVTAHLLGDDTPDAGGRSTCSATRSRTPSPDGGRARPRSSRPAAARLPARRRRPHRPRHGRRRARRRRPRPRVALDLTRLAARATGAGASSCGSPAARRCSRGGGLVAGPVEALGRTTPRRCACSPASPSRCCSSATRPGTRRGATASRCSVDAPALDPADRAAALATAHLGQRRPRVGRRSTCGSAPSRSAAPSASARLSAALAAVRVDVDRLRPARGRRTRPAWSGWPGGSSRRVGWADLVLPPAVDVPAARPGRPGPAPRPGARPSGGCGPAAAAATASPRCSPATPAPARRCRPRSSPASSGSTSTSSTSRPSSTSTSARPRRTSSGSSPRPSGVNAVLLFDEADAVFGKRSEVRDAHDRYANIESAYLLQRMETFDGLAILATNLRANIDDAFTRRLDCIIDFPAPDRGAAARRSGGRASAPAAAGRGRRRPRLLRPRVRVHRRQRPLGRDHRRLPRGRERPRGRAWPS